MKKSNNAIIVILIICTIFIISCEKDENITSGHLIGESSQLKSKNKHKEIYEKSLRKFTKIVLKSLNYKEFRKFVKSEALKEVDGDTEFLIKNVKNEKIKGDKTLYSFFENSSMEATSNLQPEKVSINFFNELELFFPNLQIYLFDKYNKWNPEKETPIVAVLPYDFDEDMEHIQAFDKNGSPFMINTKNEPEVPVIVIGLSERYDQMGNIKVAYKKEKTLKTKINKYLPIEDMYSPVGSGIAEPMECGTIVAPSDFSAQTVDRGVRLSWANGGTTHPAEWIRYYIERRTSNGSYEFIENLQGNNLNYIDDYNMEPQHQYYYRIKAIYLSKKGNHNSVYAYATGVAPQSAEEISDLDVKCYEPGEMTLTWKNNSQFRLGTKIYRRIIGRSDWQYLGAVSHPQNYFYDMPNSWGSGDQFHYRVTSYNYMGESSSQFDINYIAQRSNGEPLILHAIHIPDMSDIESWAKGKPEIVVTVATLNELGDEPVVLVDNHNLNWSKRRHSTNVFNLHICDWDNNFYKSAMSIYMFEDDNDYRNDVKAKLGVEGAIKDEENGGISTSIISTHE